MNRNLKNALALGSLVLLGATNAANAQSWDFANDFTPNAVSNTRWAYGYRSTVASTNLNLMNSNGNFGSIDFWYYSGAGSVGVPSVGKNNTAQTQSSWLLPGKAMLHPGDNAATGNLATVVRWTAPASGLYRINVLFTTVDTRGPDISAYVVSDGGIVYNSVIAGTGSTGQYIQNLNLTAGQDIDFVVGNHNNIGDKNWTQLDAHISAVSATPAPSSVLVALLGAVPLTGILRRRRK